MASNAQFVGESRRRDEMGVEIPSLADDYDSMDVMQTALSGMRSAGTRIAASAHNLANLQTENFQPQRVNQTSRASGGSEARVQESGSAARVSIAQEVVAQIQAKTQYTGSLRVLDVGSEMRGQLLDILA